MDNLCPNSSDHLLQVPETALSVALKALISHTRGCRAPYKWPCTVSLAGRGASTMELLPSDLKLRFLYLFACGDGHLT